MADSAYDRQLREQERQFVDKLRDLRRRSASTPGSTPLPPRRPHADEAGDDEDARELGEAMFSELIESSPLISTRGVGGPGGIADDIDSESNSLLDSDGSTDAAPENDLGDAPTHADKFSAGIKNEFFEDLMATPVDHLVSNRGGLGNGNPHDLPQPATKPRDDALGDSDLKITHLSEALHLQRRTTDLLHEIERTTPNPSPSQFARVSEAHLRNEDYMSPGYEYQSAAAMNLRLASQEALEAANAVQQQAVDTLSAQIRNTAAAVERVREGTLGASRASQKREAEEAEAREKATDSLRKSIAATGFNPSLVNEVRLEKAQLSAHNVRLQSKLYKAGLSILASIANARSRSMQSDAFRKWFYVAARERLNQATEMSIFQVQRYTRRARALAKFGVLLSAHRRWKILYAWKHWCSVTTLQSHEQKVQSLWREEMTKQLRRQKVHTDRMRDEFMGELDEAHQREQSLRNECKSLAEAGLSIRKVGDQRFESAVAAMKLELKDAADSQALEFKTELEDLQEKHRSAVEALAQQHAQHLESQHDAMQREIDAKDEQLKQQAARADADGENKDKQLREHVATLQKRHSELLQLTIGDHDQQIKELVDSLKTHAASVEASARERVRKVQEECEKETEAAVREADAAHEKALERARQEASAQQQELVDAHHEQLQELENLRLATLAKQQQLVALHGEQIENLRHSEQVALARAAEQNRVQQIEAEEQYHEDLHAIVEKSKDQQQKLLAALEQKQKREAEEILSSEAVKSSEKLNELMENCERRIKAEKLAAETQIERTESNAKVNEEHALKVQQMQLNNEWKSKLQEEDHERQKHAAEKLKEALKRQASEHEANVKDVEAALQRRFLQSQQLLKDELELGRDQSIIDTTRSQQQALQEVVEAAQEQKQAFEAELADQRAKLRAAEDKLEAQRVAHEALKADVALREASVERASRTVHASSHREQQLRAEVEEQKQAINSLKNHNNDLRVTQQRVLAQDALQHLSMTMIERSISVRGLFERLDRSQAGWLTREDFLLGIPEAFPIGRHRHGHRGDGSSLFTAKQLDALFHFMDSHGTGRIGWESFAHCFTAPGQQGEPLSPLRFSNTAKSLLQASKVEDKARIFDGRYTKSGGVGESPPAGDAEQGGSGHQAGDNSASARAPPFEPGSRLLTQMRLRQIPRAKLDRIRARLRASAYRHTDLGGWNLRRLFERRDRNRDGSLDRDEFLATIRKELRLPSHEVSDEDVEILFNALDVSGSGQLHLDQLYMLLGENGDKTSQENDGSGSRAGMVDASRVLSPRSQRQNQQRAASNSSKPHGDSPNASLSMSMLQSQNNGDRSLDINDSSRESKAKWEQRIQFLIKLYRMNVLNDKVLQKLSDRDLERSIKAVRAARSADNGALIDGVDRILIEALNRRGRKLPR